MTICLYLLAFIFNKSLCNIFFNSLFLSANTYQVYLYYSSLENPMDGGAWRATIHGIARVGHNLVTKPPPPPPPSICYMQDAVFYIILGFVLKKPKGSPEKSAWGGEEAICPEPDSVQSLSRVRLCDPMDCSTPVLPVHHQLLEFTQTHFHWVGDTIQPSHSLSSPSPPACNLSQHQGFF